MAAPQLPYILNGIVYDSEGNSLNNVGITILNESSDAELTTTTNGSGQYAIDLANFSGGYLSGDKITVGITDTPVFEHWTSIDAGKNWLQVENNTETTIVYNTSRFKQNSSYYPGGRTINIVRSA